MDCCDTFDLTESVHSVVSKVCKPAESAKPHSDSIGTDRKAKHKSLVHK